MVTIKSRKSARSTPRKKRSSKRSNGLIKVSVTALVLLVLTLSCVAYFLKWGPFRKSYLNTNIHDSSSLIQDDEKIYREAQDRDENKHPSHEHKLPGEKIPTAKEKAEFNPPRYREKDKDYLNKIIKSR